MLCPHLSLKSVSTSLPCSLSSAVSTSLPTVGFPTPLLTPLPVVPHTLCRGPTPKGGEYIRISPEEIADDYPMPAQYEKVRGLDGRNGKIPETAAGGSNIQGAVYWSGLLQATTNFLSNLVFCPCTSTLQQEEEDADEMLLFYERINV